MIDVFPRFPVSGVWLGLLVWSKRQNRRWLWNVVVTLFALGAVNKAIVWQVLWAKAGLWMNEY